MITITRKFHFSASHYYSNPNWSEEKNLQTFGKCANKNGHGHNYVLEVTLSGEINPETGYVMDLHQVTELVKTAVLEELDHRNLNIDVTFFHNNNPTMENICRFIWKKLQPILHGLQKITLWETPELYCEYAE
ncbi:MAG: 6-carboxytetrahydropterin synthase [bacterium]